MDHISALTTKRNHLLADATTLVNRGLNTPEIKAEYERLVGESDGIQEQLDMLARIERHQASAIAEGSLSSASAPVTRSTPSVVFVSDSAEQRKAQLNMAARSFFKHGARALDNMPSEMRALLTTSDTTGGALISQSFDTIFTEAAKFFGNVWNLVNRKDSTTGEPTKFAVSDDTARTFSLLSEGTTSAVSVAQTPTLFSDITNNDTLISSAVYSIQELDDAFDLESFLRRNAGVAVSRAWEYALTKGLDNGTNSALPNSPNGGILGLVSAGVTQTSGTLAAGVTYAQLSALAASVDRAYYQTGAFMASPSVEAYLRGVEDSTGRPLYAIDPDTGLLEIAGRVLYPNAAMPANGTASAPLVTFGDYSKFYNVLNVGGLRIKVLTESPATNFFSHEMIMYTRIGASAGLSSAVKSLVSAAS